MNIAAPSHPGRGRPAAGQAEQITRRVLDAAWAVLLDLGPELLTLDRVAASAHASKQTIYARYSGKRELLQAVLEAQFEWIYAEFREAAAAGDLEAIIAEVTRRSATTLSAPETEMLVRLADWIDAPLEGYPTREGFYVTFHSLLCHYLRASPELAHLPEPDLRDAATLWLDSLIGHVRGVPRGGEELERWSRRFAGYFMRAVGV